MYFRTFYEFILFPLLLLKDNNLYGSNITCMSS